MKVLLIASRPPSPAFTGDSARTRMWLDALCEIASVTVIAPPPASDKLPCSRYVVVRRSLTSFLAAVFRIIRERLPLHLAVPGQWNWADAIRRAADFGPYDVAIVMLSRLDPLVSPSLGKTRAILDAIDSLTTNLRERQRAAGPVASRLWSFEAERMSRLEASIAERYCSVVTVSRDQTPPFGESVIVPMGVSVLEMPEVERDFDVAFWGRLPYFANDDAVRCLLRRVWPEIRNRRPQATLLIAGADAAGWVRRHDGANGIRVFSPMKDRPGLLRRVKVAVFPISFGSGLPMKTLEAAEASCAIVGTPMAFRGFADLSRVAVVEPIIDRIGAATVSLLEDSERRVAMGTRLRSIVMSQYAMSRTYDEMRRVVERAVAG